MEDDVIVIASTSKDGNETETASISSVENGGYRIVLHNPVNFTHFGITDVLEDGQFIDIRYRKHSYYSMLCTTAIIGYIIRDVCLP